MERIPAMKYYLAIAAFFIVVAFVGGDRIERVGKRGLTAALRSFIKCCDLDSYVGGAWHGQQVRRDSE